MAKVRIVGLALLTGLVLLAGCKSGGEAAAMPETVPIQNRLHGSNAGLKLEGARLINNKDELAAAGAQDLFARQNLDFGKQSVVLVSLGKRTAAGYWVRVVSVERSGSDLYVQAVANAPGMGAAAAAQPGAPSSPYDAVIISKIKSAMVHPEIKSVTGQADTPDAAVSSFIATAK